MKRFDKKFFERSQESWVGIKNDEFLEMIPLKCQKILTEEKLTELLKSGGKLKVKFGIDPSTKDVHLGHIVPIMLLRQFQKTGHQIDFIIGDFTARIGDPSGRSTARNILTEEQIENNMGTFKEQIGKFIDISSMNIHFNSSWLGKMLLSDVFSMFQAINLTEAVQRNDFRERVTNKQNVSLAEVCYGSLMGIDSLELKTDIEIGGIDQLLNFQQCRKIMQFKGMKEEVILMTPIIEGINGDGRKMSKSFGNFIAVSDSPINKFGKILSMPDRLISPFFSSFANTRKDEKDDLELFINDNPFEAKKQLATFIVSLEFNNLENGLIARENFERKFSDKKIIANDSISLQATNNSSFFEILNKSNHFKSNSDLRRLFNQKSVHLVKNDKISKVILLEDEITENCIIKIGKKRFFNIKIFN